MNRTLSYSLIVEGSDELVIKLLIKKMIEKYNSMNSNIRFELKHYPKYKIAASANSSKGKIYKKLPSILKDCFSDKNVQLAIVGVDLDKPDHDLKLHKNEIDLLKRTVPDIIQNKKGLKIIFFVAIQSIEAWLSYQYKENQTPNSQEKFSSVELKRRLYGRGRIKTKLVSEIADKIDLDILIKQSKSFALFNSEFTNSLNLFAS